MKHRKKILVFAQSNVGGAERVSVTITKSLDERLYDLTYCLVGMSKQNDFPLEQFLPEHRKVVKIRKTNPLVLMLKMLWLLFVIRPNVVFSSTLFINDKVLILSLLFPWIRFIVRCENYLYTFNEKQLRVIKRTYHWADKIIAQTEEMKQELVEQMNIKADKIVVLHNPLDKTTIDSKVAQSISPFHSDDTVHFVASGRFSYQKGFDLLIQAFALVHSRIPKSELYIIGDNTGRFEKYYEELKVLIAKYNVGKSVYCVGYTDNPYVYMKHADCFVLSSRWEGMPNVLLEAMYLGTPVAAYTCIPIIERIVENGVNGSLAEAENVEALAEAMLASCKMDRISLNFKLSSVEDFHALLVE